MTLTEFLLARIAEDEEAARDAAGWDPSGRVRATGRWSRTGISSLEDDQQRSVIYSDNNQLTGTVAEHIARHDPARVLARCAADRRIVELHRAQAPGPRPGAVCDFCVEDIDITGEEVHYEPYPCLMLRLLALSHTDHPDYQQEWRP